LRTLLFGRELLVAWTALILLSQTTWAGELAGWIVAFFFGPGPKEIGSPPYLLQKGYHCLLFGVFGWLLARARQPLPPVPALALAILFGGFAELLQTLAPGRNAQFSDAVINSVSATLAWTLSAIRRGAVLPAEPAVPVRRKS
jgi:hypothetical protein